jgi:hypothetical protein
MVAMAVRGRGMDDRWHAASAELLAMNATRTFAATSASGSIETPRSSASTITTSVARP